MVLIYSILQAQIHKTHARTLHMKCEGTQLMTANIVKKSGLLYACHYFLYSASSPVLIFLGYFLITHFFSVFVPSAAWEKSYHIPDISMNSNLVPTPDDWLCFSKFVASLDLLETYRVLHLPPFYCCIQMQSSTASRHHWPPIIKQLRKRANMLVSGRLWSVNWARVGLKMAPRSPFSGNPYVATLSM